MQKVHLKVAIFALVVIGFYTYYANSIPQLERRPPEEIVVTEAASPEDLARLGRQLFFGKGACAVCHTLGQPGTRAPDLQGIGSRAATRKPGMSAKAYIIESLVNPSAFLVPGFPPIMPPVNKPPVALNRGEMLALVAFLQSLGGVVDVKMDDIPGEAAPAPAAVAPAAPRVAGDAKAGEGLFASKGCVACHKVAGAGGAIGPDLSDVGARRNLAYISEAIINPNAEITPGYPPVMPPDFAEKLTVKELNDLVAYLAGLKGKKQP